MPYVEGESLRNRLRREHRLTLNDALEIGRQIADALGAAHATGIVHRDVKPENILLAGYARTGANSPAWHAMLADFGVAKAIGGTQSDPPADPSALRTDSGLPVGTVAYASPEQAAGSRGIDGRSDIYSLGCVLYEMLVGDAPDDGPAASEILEHRFTAPLPPIRSARPDIPEWVDRATARALSPNPSDRFSSAAEFRSALSLPIVDPGASSPAAAVPSRRSAPRRRQLLWMSAGAGALALVGTAVAFLPHRSPDSDPKQVVVAGFENRTGDSALASIGDIASDYIARGLVATRLLHEVYDARAAARESGTATRIDPAAGRRLGRKVGAGTLVWGNYYRVGDSLHFEAQLLDVGSGRVIVPLEPVVGPLSKPTSVVETLRQRVMAAFAVMTRRPGFEPWQAQSIPPTYEAYQEMLAANEAAWSFDPQEAVRHLRQALALDSSFIGAKAGLAVALEESGRCTESDSITQSLAAVRERLAPVDRGSVEWAAAMCRGDLDGAVDASRAVIDAAPQSVGARIVGGIMALEAFRPREALRLLTPLESRKDELTGSPRHMYPDFLTIAYHELGDYARELAINGGGGALAGLGRVAEARASVKAMLANNDPKVAQCLSLELRAHGHAGAAREAMGDVVSWYQAHPETPSVDQEGPPCLWLSLSAFYYVGDWDRARADYERLATGDKTRVGAWAGLGALAARRGDRVEVARIDRRLAHPINLPGTAAYARARMAAILGDRDKAVALLRLAFKSGIRGRMYIHYDPDFESIRDYPPYRELMRIRDD
jgi:serine/threonine-protein kinase